MPLVSSLFVYPVKSCRGLSVSELEFARRGPIDDRRWMVVDPEGRFLTLRRNSLLGQVQPARRGSSGIELSAPGMPTVRIAVPGRSAARVEVRIWKYTGPALDAGSEAANWLGRVLGEPCRLVMFDPKARRSVSQEYTDRPGELAFADGYPALVTTLESLTELNRQLATPVPMNRFRPNIVLRDCRPFEEDEWRILEGDGIRLHLIKPCSRCIATCVDIESLERSKEPLRTLGTFRRNELGVLFGQNAMIEGVAKAVLRVGEELRVVERRSALEFNTPVA